MEKYVLKNDHFVLSLYSLEKYHTLWIKTESGKTHWNGNCRHPTIPIVDLKDLAERINVRKVDDLDNIYPQYMRTASKPNIDFSNGFSQTVIDNVINLGMLNKYYEVLKKYPFLNAKNTNTSSN